MYPDSPDADATTPKPCSRILPPFWFLAAILAMIALDGWLPLKTIIPRPWTFAGLLPIAAGLALLLAAAGQFVHHGTTVKPYAASDKLVADGIFRFTRNPMYLGLTLMLSGVALLLGSLTPWLLVAAFPCWIQHCFIRAEEQALAARFGAEFNAYRTRTRRWL